MEQVANIRPLTGRSNTNRSVASGASSNRLDTSPSTLNRGLSRQSTSHPTSRSSAGLSRMGSSAKSRVEYSEDGTLNHEGFLLLHREQYKGPKRTIKTVRTFCRLEDSELRCYCNAGEPDLLGRYGHNQKPTHFLNLQECIEIYVPPHTIEESIAKCATRKKNNDPLNFEIVMHRSDGAPRKRLAFAAEAGGGVRRWIAYLRAAMWIGRDLPMKPEILRLPEQKPQPTVNIKVLLDLALHPERVREAREAKASLDAHSESKGQDLEYTRAHVRKGETLKSPSILVARQTKCPRGLVFITDLSTSTGDCIRRRLGQITGLPTKCFTLWQKPEYPGDPLRRLLDGCWNQPLDQWLHADHQGHALVFAGLVDQNEFVSKQSFSPKPTLPTTYCSGRFTVDSKVCY